MRIIGIEEWKPYPHEVRYEISSLGNVRKRINISHPERNNPYLFMVPFLDKDGYKRISLSINGKSKKIHVHRLVYETFNGPLVDGLVCCHIDGSRINNKPENLTQATQKENIGHKREHGTWQAGENHPRAKLTNEKALQVKLLLQSASRTKTGRYAKNECNRIAQLINVDPSLVYSISRTRSTYVTA